MKRDKEYKTFDRNDRAINNEIPKEEYDILLGAQNLNELCRCAKESEVIKRAIEANRGLAVAIDKIAIKARGAVESLPLRPADIYNAWERYKETKNYTLLNNLYKQMNVKDNVFLATQMPQWKYVWQYVNRYKWGNESEEDAVVRQGTIEMVCDIIREYARRKKLLVLECEQPQANQTDGQTNGEPQRKKKTQIKKKNVFRDIVQAKDKEPFMKRLHELIDGKGGVDVGVVIVAAVDIHKHLTRYPHEKEFMEEFKNIKGSWKAISNTFYKAEKEDNGILSKASVIVF